MNAKEICAWEVGADDGDDHKTVMRMYAHDVAVMLQEIAYQLALRNEHDGIMGDE